MPYFRMVSAIVYTALAALVAFTILDAGAHSWFATLIRPASFFPTWLFGLAWMLMYVFMGGALAIVWMEPHSHSRDGWVRYYFVQLLFNLAFVYFFFKMHAVLISFLGTLFLGLMVLSLLAGGYDHDRRVTYLLIPYFMFIVFTGYMTLNIWRLN